MARVDPLPRLICDLPGWGPAAVWVKYMEVTQPLIAAGVDGDGVRHCTIQRPPRIVISFLDGLELLSVVSWARLTHPVRIELPFPEEVAAYTAEISGGVTWRFRAQMSSMIIDQKGHRATLEVCTNGVMDSEHVQSSRCDTDKERSTMESGCEPCPKCGRSQDFFTIKELKMCPTCAAAQITSLTEKIEELSGEHRKSLDELCAAQDRVVMLEARIGESQRVIEGQAQELARVYQRIRWLKFRQTRAEGSDAG